MAGADGARDGGGAQGRGHRGRRVSAKTAAALADTQRVSKKELGPEAFGTNGERPAGQRGSTCPQGPGNPERWLQGNVAP